MEKSRRENWDFPALDFLGWDFSEFGILRSEFSIPDPNWGPGFPEIHKSESNKSLNKLIFKTKI